MKAKQIINNKINSMDSDASFGKNIVLDQEILLLQQCNYKLPIDKAKKILAYKPEISFQEASHRTCEWLKFALGLG